MSLGYYIKKILDPVHQDINIIITMKYQSYPPLRPMTTEMALKNISFISAIVRWIDDNYESLQEGGNTKEDVWWIATRVIRSIFED